MKTFIGILFSLCMALLLPAQTVLINPYQFAAAAGSSGGTGDILTETFEGSNSGYDNTGWSNFVGSAGINPDYTGVVLAGSQSLRINATTTDQSIIKTISDPNECWIYFQYRPVTSSGGVATRGILTGFNGSIKFSIAVASGGLLVVSHNAASATTSAGMSVGTTYNIWAYYLKGTGANGVASVAFSSTTTRPTSGTAFASLTNGDSTTALHELVFASDDSGFGMDAVFDTIKVSSTSSTW